MCDGDSKNCFSVKKRQLYNKVWQTLNPRICFKSYVDGKTFVKVLPVCLYFIEKGDFKFICLLI